MGAGRHSEIGEAQKPPPGSVLEEERAKYLTAFLLRAPYTAAPWLGHEW